MSENNHALRDVVAALPHKPGVYRFYDQQDQLLYVGKAKRLKARVSSYFRQHHDHPKVAAMVARIARLETTVLLSEYEALLHEHDQIKTHRPPYNILLKDGKSYPYLHFSGGAYPRLRSYRGKRKIAGQLFGPYPTVHSVEQALVTLQKVFKLRHCDDRFFQARQRPCLQYQIKRCSAPCVAKVSQTDYQQSVKQAKRVLQGKEHGLVDDLVDNMQQASTAQNYELAARCRDQIRALKQLQAPQHVDVGDHDCDVLACAHFGEHACISVMMVRQGKLLGHSDQFMSLPTESSQESLMEQFIVQHYLGLVVTEQQPKRLVLAHLLPNAAALSELLSQHFVNEVIVSQCGRRQHEKTWLQMAQQNAEQSLSQHMSQRRNLFQRFEVLAHQLKCEVLPELIDCFDISHTQGQDALGVAVRCGHHGLLKSAYRRYEMRDITPGDDYAAMTQTLLRHYQHLQKKNMAMPSIILIDGGLGQLRAAKKAVDELQLDEILLMSISKGKARRAGEELIWLDGCSSPLYLAAESPAMHLLQYARDEAHRFAITGHRKKRQKSSLGSTLLDVKGVGPQLRRHLLDHFGGIEGIKSATVEQLCQVPKLGPALAMAIHKHFHSD